MTKKEVDRKGRVVVIGCGALAREMMFICKVNNLDHVDFKFLPASLHNEPHLITDRVSDAIKEARESGYGNILIGYGDCGTGGMLDALCEKEGVSRIEGPHCYSFFYGNDGFEDDFLKKDLNLSFYLTDFLARQFDTLVWQFLKLDKYPELRDDYFKNYRYLVYLAQTKDDKLEDKAREAANKLGLPYRYVFTGYGGLEKTLLSLEDTLSKDEI